MAQRPPSTEPSNSLASRLRGRLEPILDSRRFEKFITILIIVNAITLGLETSKTAMAVAGDRPAYRRPGDPFSFRRRIAGADVRQGKAVLA